MRQGEKVFIALLFFAASGFCDKEVAFLGLTGEAAPAIEKTFNRHFLEQLAVMPDVRSLNTIEIANLRERTSGNFNIASLTPAFFTSLKRFVSDSTHLIWGRVKECTIKPERFWVVGAGIRSTLTIELSVYDLALGSFEYIGDVKATTLEKRWFVLWWSVDRAIQISAQERTQLLDDLELKSVSASGRILATLMLNEKVRTEKKSGKPSDSSKKAKASNKTPQNEEPPYLEEETSTPGKPDSAAVESAKRK
jgi:hypothetical protein